MSTSRSNAMAACLVLLIWLQANAAPAADLLWNNTPTGNFNDLNWIDTSTGNPWPFPPGPSDVANINSGIVTVNSNVQVGLISLSGTGGTLELRIPFIRTLTVNTSLATAGGLLQIDGSLIANDFGSSSANSPIIINGNAQIATSASFVDSLTVGGSLTAASVSTGDSSTITGTVNTDALSNSGIFDATGGGLLNMVGAIGSNRTINNQSGVMRLNNAMLETVYASDGLWELSSGQIDAFNDSRFNDVLLFATDGTQLLLDDSQIHDSFVDFTGAAAVLQLAGATGSTATGGTLQFQNGAVLDVQSGSSIVPNGGNDVVRLLDGGMLIGDGSVLSPLLNSGSTVSPGNSVGTLTLGDYTQESSGTMVIELDATGNDLVDITGTANLNGTLDVQLAGGFIPSQGQQFQILNYATRVGEFVTISGLDLGGGMALLPSYNANDLTLTVGAPDLHFVGLAGDRQWDTSANWTMGILPATVNNVFVDPTNGANISGSAADTTVSNLTIGTSAGGVGTTTLELQNDARLTVSGSTTIEPAGRLTGVGSLLVVGGVVNQGEIDLDAEQLTVLGGLLSNQGVVRGAGEIAAAVDNQAAGEVRAAAGQRLRMTGASVVNAGRIEALGSTFAPAELEFSPLVTNSTGEIAARNALLRFHGGLDNSGTFSISFGTSDVFGNVNNLSGGLVVVSFYANATFYDDVVNNGELRTSAGSAAVFFGDVSGSGSYTGTGEVRFEGTFSPGSSPAAVAIEADASFGAGSTLEIELGGLIPGEQYDQLQVGGLATLDGSLQINLINGFLPTVGDQFELLTYGAFDGAFEEVRFAGGLDGVLDYGASSLMLTITAVPEPAAIVLFLLSISALQLSRCKREFSQQQ